MESDRIYTCIYAVLRPDTSIGNIRVPTHIGVACELPKTRIQRALDTADNHLVEEALVLVHMQAVAKLR